MMAIAACAAVARAESKPAPVMVGNDMLVMGRPTEVEPNNTAAEVNAIASAGCPATVTTNAPVPQEDASVGTI